jgi:SAM-dependent methyltransferase
MDLAFSSEEVNPLVNAICQEALRTGANPSIHQRDEMYEFFFYRNQRDRDRSVTMYLHSGFLIWATLREVLAWHFAPGRDPVHPENPGRDPVRPGQCGVWRIRSLLDFAGGYGRVTRFIAAELGPEKVWSAEINQEALDFQQRHFGVHTLLSSAAPEAFGCDRRFDVVLACSLFTHLPRERFIGWMHKLLGLLAPGGILLFSVHDESLQVVRSGGGALGGDTLAGGFRFEPESESAVLPAHEYGSTWVSEPFVRSLLGAAAPAATVRRLPRGLANFQDLYVAAGDSGSGSAAAARGELRVQRRIDGFVEHCSLAATRTLLIIGWVIDRVSAAPPREVQAWVDGKVVDRCDDLAPRPEVMPQFPDDKNMALGWRLTAELPAKGPLCPCELVIRVISGSGEELLLYADSVESALLRSMRLDFLATNAQMLRERQAAEERLREASNGLQHLINLRDIRVAALEATIAAMEASRFWRIRNQWFRLKRALHLTTQP